MGSSEKLAAFAAQQEDKMDEMQHDAWVCGIMDVLFDPRSFVTLGSYVKPMLGATSFSREPVAGDGVITGYGRVNGRLVYAAVQNPAVYGGSVGRAHAAKIERVIDLAIEAQAPFVSVFSSGGARVEEGVLALEGFAGVLSALTAAKGRIPLLGIVAGPCPGALAVAAARHDHLFFSQTEAGLYMNSPAVTAACSKEAIDIQTIGDAATHASATGLAASVEENAPACAQKLKTLLSYLPLPHPIVDGFVRDHEPADDPNRLSERLDEIAASIDQQNYSMREIVTEIADDNQLFEVSAAYAPALVTGYIKLDGLTVGVIANQERVLTRHALVKMRRFVRALDMLSVPLLTLTDVHAFEVGPGVEDSDIVEMASELVDAVATCGVPRVSILVGSAIGSAYMFMNSKMLGADMTFAWPTAEVSAMPPQTAVSILSEDEIAQSKDPIQTREKLIEAYRRDVCDPMAVAATGQVDEVIMPSATRPRVISAMDTLLSGRCVSEQ